MEVLAEAPKEQASHVASYTVVAYGAAFLPQDYRALIYSRWLRSLRHGNDFFKLIKPAKAYYDAYHRYIENVLRNYQTIVRLAVLSDDDDVVLGFSVSRGTILEFVHVDKDQRRHGIGKSLVPSSIDTITHLTRIGLTIWGSKYKNWHFNPFA